MEFTARKPNRLTDFSYNAPGAYFITICTKGKKCTLWKNVGASIARPQPLPLSSTGKIVEQAIQNIPIKYPALSVDHYVVMPNHIHLLLQIHTDPNGRPMAAPTISTVVQQMKGYASKKAGTQLWQKLFHDHVIRNQQDYLEIWKYIDGNPANWCKDCFYELMEDIL